MRLAPYQTGKCPSHGGKTSRVKGGAIVPDLPLPTQGALQEGLSTSNPALPAVPPSALPPVPEVAGAPLAVPAPMPPPPVPALSTPAISAPAVVPQVLVDPAPLPEVAPPVMSEVTGEANI
mmetsp:Transcript_1910/g.4042  ORF Transcript_1910/g.4042 Transcript_1910/m.4042 type:complete len:121 (-) Transcript_1910:120-482(-)